MKIKLPLIGSGNQSQGIQLNPSSLINFYVSTTYGVDAVKSKEVLLRTPGTTLWSISPNQGTFRGWLETNNVLYVVMTSKLYSVSTSKVWTELGTLTSATTRVSMVSNGLQLFIDTGSEAWTYTYATATFAAMNDADYNYSGYVTELAGRVISAIPSTNRFQISAINDATSWAALDYDSFSNDSENLVAVFSNRTELYLFGRKNTEIHAHTGNADFPFEKKVGLNIFYGCAAKETIQYVNGTIIWLARNAQGKALLMSLTNYTPQIVLSEADNYQIQSLSTISDAVARTFEFNGHVFYAIWFPTEAKTFLLDTLTSKFIQLKSWKSNGTDADGNVVYTLSRHIMDDIILFNDMILVADYRATGTILEYSKTTQTDYLSGPSNTIYSECILPVISNEEGRLTINSLELDYEKGVSIYTEEDFVQNPALNQPLANISLSKNAGREFNYIRTVNLGYKGQ